MWLLNAHTRELETFQGSNIPPYAILSHVWGEDELTFKDVQKIRYKGKKGYHKVDLCCNQAIEHGFHYAWIDTCCIDKRSSAELSEAINSMYRWYSEAAVCYAFLADIVVDKNKMTESRWFARGWTLQELLAPENLIFFDQSWNIIGDKWQLSQEITDRTRIPRTALAKFSPQEYIIAQKMSWAANRTTTRVEDRAYSLLGIFDVNMPLLYGEGEKAFHRLQDEIAKTSTDPTLFGWCHSPRVSFTMLAASPGSFASSVNEPNDDDFIGDLICKPITTNYTFSKIGVSGVFELIQHAFNIYIVALASCNSRRFLPTIRGQWPGGKAGMSIARAGQCLQIYVQYWPSTNTFHRVSLDGTYRSITPERIDWSKFQKRDILIESPFRGQESSKQLSWESIDRLLDLEASQHLSTPDVMGAPALVIGCPANRDLYLDDHDPLMLLRSTNYDIQDLTRHDLSANRAYIIVFRQLVIHFGHDINNDPRVFISMFDNSFDGFCRRGAELNLRLSSAKIKRFMNTNHRRMTITSRHAKSSPIPSLEHLSRLPTVKIGHICRVTFDDIGDGHRILLSFDGSWDELVKSTLPVHWYVPPDQVEEFWALLDERERNAEQ